MTDGVQTISSPGSTSASDCTFETVECTAGKVSNNGRCVPCPIDTYSETLAQRTSCSVCPSDTYSDEGSNDVSDCISSSATSFRMVSGNGNCAVSGNCFSSLNYDNNEVCEFKVQVGGLLKFQSFETESGYDELSVLEMEYSGSTTPVGPLVVSVDDVIGWTSDSSATRGGFQVCIDTLAISCAGGKYASGGECVACPENYFASGSGIRTECSACPSVDGIDKVSLVGSKQESDCDFAVINCAEGSYAKNGFCVECPENTFASEIGQRTSCVACGKGQWSNGGSFHCEENDKDDETAKDETAKDETAKDETAKDETAKDITPIALGGGALAALVGAAMLVVSRRKKLRERTRLSTATLADGKSAAPSDIKVVVGEPVDEGHFEMNPVLLRVDSSGKVSANDKARMDQLKGGFSNTKNLERGRGASSTSRSSESASQV